MSLETIALSAGGVLRGPRHCHRVLDEMLEIADQGAFYASKVSIEATPA